MPCQFLSTLSLRRATGVPFSRLAYDYKFLSTLSLRRATCGVCWMSLWMRYFYPRSPCGERRTKTALTSTVLNFYPRSPCGERPMTSIYFHGIFYFYPRSPCGERPAHKMGRDWLIDISIHALLAESDIFPSGTAPLVRNFYPRSPCGERPLLSRNTLFDTAISIHALLAESDQPRPTAKAKNNTFLSTLSLRRATDSKC